MLRLRHIPAPGATRLALVLACAMGLAGCGIKGPLEPPPGAQAAAAPPPQAAAAAQSKPAATAPIAPAGTKPRATETANAVSQPEWQNSSRRTTSATTNLLKGAQKPDQPFILDGLL